MGAKLRGETLQVEGPQLQKWEGESFFSNSVKNFNTREGIAIKAMRGFLWQFRDRRSGQW